MKYGRFFRIKIFSIFNSIQFKYLFHHIGHIKVQYSQKLESKLTFKAKTKAFILTTFYNIIHIHINIQ